MQQTLLSSFTVVQAIDIDCSVAKACSFMNNAPQWLPWAMPQVESVQPLPFGQWLILTTKGMAKLRPRYDAAHGILAYELVNPTTGAWRVPVRVEPTPTGCHLVITFSKPEHLALNEFETSMQYTTEGLHTFKLALERE